MARKLTPQQKRLLAWSASQPDYGYTATDSDFDAAGFEAAAQALPRPQEPSYEPVYEPSYDSASGYVYDAPPSLGRLDESPDWAAFNAELDRAMAFSRADADRRKGIVSSDRDRLLSELEPRGELEREGIQGGYESRGLFGGGAMAQAIARQRSNQERRAGSISADAAARASDIEAELGRQLLETEQRRVQARIDFLARGFTA